MENSKKNNRRNASNKSIDEQGTNEKWTAEMDLILVDAFVHQQDMGNRVNGTFTPRAYENIEKELSDKLKRKITKQNVKNRMKTVKKIFNDCYDIFKGGMSGFSWNPQTNMWGAEPEVWKDLIEAKPLAKKWMNTSISNYEKLLILYGKDRASGIDAETAKEKARRWSEIGVDDPNTINDLDKLVSNDDVFLQTFFSNNTQTNENQPFSPNEVNPILVNKATTSSAPSKKRKASLSSLEISELQVQSMQEIAFAMSTGNEILNRRNEILEKSIPIQVLYTETDVYDELVRLGFDNVTLILAYTFLISDPLRMRAFFGCRAENRVDFLNAYMRSAGVSINDR